MCVFVWITLWSGKNCCQQTATNLLQSSALCRQSAFASRQAPTSRIKTKKGGRCLAANKKDIRVMNCLLLFTESNRTQRSAEQRKYTKI